MQPVSLFKALVQSLRPRQWTKNLLVFAAPLFSLSILKTHEALVAAGVFLIFCLSAGAIYLMNDLFDRERDRLHPLKKNRPLASGVLKVQTAAAVSIFLFLTTLAAGAYISTGTLICIGIYYGINVLYNLILKRIVIIDLFAVTAGYLIRVIAGAVAINVAISHWLLLCTFLLALFLILCKRRNELATVKDAISTRPVLSNYSLPFLDQLITVTAGLTALSYALYTVAPQTVAKFGTTDLIYTFPFVLFGIVRYLYVASRGEKAGSPEQVLLTDGWMLGTILTWLAAVAAVLYF